MDILHLGAHDIEQSHHAFAKFHPICTWESTVCQIVTVFEYTVIKPCRVHRGPLRMHLRPWAGLTSSALGLAQVTAIASAS